eukprot:NODE_1701_length_907_cov_232.231935_g1184_i0.p2 GENE.NODE_1701_length_907_cov_232.231935_g1184_i0~~NODE_1701_length_907_cov_232.231935_g1184_i0.p2  ORF type:complete len:268 (+),score=86.71 NODE_1701_length_907_cov_232.231935_g1184_i0:58-804(+)
MVDNAGGTLPQEDTTSWLQASPDFEANWGTRTFHDYRNVTAKGGIPVRPNGLFPPDDPLLMALVKDPLAHPYQKHLLGQDGELQMATKGWIATDTAAAHGLDLRYFWHEKKSKQLLGVVRFGSLAKMGADQPCTIHGGAIMSVLDEMAAEVVKANRTTLVMTDSISFSFKTMCPCYTTLNVLSDIVKEESVGDLERYTVKAQLTEPGPKQPNVIATAEAVIVDVTERYDLFNSDFTARRQALGVKASK